MENTQVNGTNHHPSAEPAPARADAGTLKTIPVVDWQTSSPEASQDACLEMLALFARNVTHEFKNLLLPFVIASPLLREQTHDPELRDLLQTLELNIQRANAWLDQLTAFAAEPSAVKQPVHTRALLDELAPALDQLLPGAIVRQVDIPADLWAVPGIAGQLRQVWLNLCANARDAMPDGGTLKLTARNVRLWQPDTSATPPLPAGAYVVWRVADTGAGIAPADQEHLFDPFFTTKRVSHGLGLGLPAIQRIVRQHGGILRVESAPNRGTCFSVFLPATPGSSLASTPAKTAVSAGSGELILLVDDEESIRRVARQVLERHGYQVVTAATGNEALRVFSERRAEVRLVLADWLMPEMDGPALIRSLRELDPRVPCIISSGRDVRSLQNMLDDLRISAVLPKPFTPPVLLTSVRDVLQTSELLSYPAN